MRWSVTAEKTLRIGAALSPLSFSTLTVDGTNALNSPEENKTDDVESDEEGEEAAVQSEVVTVW